MEKYQNRGGNSAIVAFAISDASICVQFKGGKTYKYSSWKPGKSHLEKMKLLARSGKGLNTYINQHVKFDYESKNC